MRRTLAAAVVLAMAVVSGALIARGSDDLRSNLSQALAAVPEETLTANFTDWGRLGESLDAADVTSTSSRPERQAVLDAAYENDLTEGSALAGSALAMAEPYGWSAFDVEWEMFGQAREGAVVVARLGDGIAADSVQSALADLGYQRPDDGSAVWVGGPDLLATIGQSLTPLLEHVAVLADEGLVVLSDKPAYVERTVETIESGSSDLGSQPEVVATAAPLDGAIMAVVHRPPRSCVVTSYASASMADRDLAAARVAEAGGIRPHQGLGFGVVRDDDGFQMVVSMHFESASDAQRQRGPRTALARGPAIGQGGTYDERFDVANAQVRGANLVLWLRPREGTLSLVSDLASGPLMFAGCDG